MTVDPDLSVIVVTHNGRDRALDTLASAREHLGPIRAEWFVIDSGSSDGTPDAIEARWPDVRLMRRSNQGFSASNNVALAQARGRHVLLLNPDVDIAQGTLADVVAALDARPAVGAVSVVQRGPDGRLLPSIRRFPSVLRQWGEATAFARIPGGRFLGESDMTGWERERSADWLVGAFLAVRRAALEQIGPLDERFFLYSEETDWCMRLRRAGWDVRHLPQVAVVHHQGGYQRPELAAQLAFSKLLFARKHYGRGRVAGIRTGLAVGHALRVPVFSALAMARPTWRARARGHQRALAMTLGVASAPSPVPSLDSRDVQPGGMT